MADHTLLESQPPAVAAGSHAQLEYPGSALARFLELRGRRIVRGCGAVWYAIPDRFLMSLPYQAMLNPEPAELRQLIRETHTLRRPLPLDGVERPRKRTLRVAPARIRHRVRAPQT